MINKNKEIHAKENASDWEGPAPRAIVAFKRKMAH